MGVPNYDLDTSTCLDIYSRTQNTFGVTDFNLPITTSTSSCRQSLSRELEPPSKRLKRDEVTKKFRCTHEGCAKSFGKSDHLKTHIRTHTGEKPFRCSSCAKGFSDLANLKRHIRVHTGEKPFTCTHPGCGKMFSVSSNLKQHRRTHTGERPYSCTICHKTFSHVSSRRKHLACHESDVVKSVPRSYKVEFEPPQLSYNSRPVQIKNEFSPPPPMYTVPVTSSPNNSVSSNEQFSPYNPYQTITPPAISPNMQAYIPEVKYDVTSQYNTFSQPRIPYLVCTPNMVNYSSPASIYTSPTSVYTSPQAQTYASPSQVSSYNSPSQGSCYNSPVQAKSYASPAQTTYASPSTQVSYSSPTPLESYSSPVSYTSPVHTADIDTSLDDISPSITFENTVSADSAIACAQQKPAETFTDIPVPDLRDAKLYSPEAKLYSPEMKQQEQSMIVHRILCEPLYEYVFAALALLVAEHGTIIGQVPVDKMIGFASEVSNAVQIIHRDQI